MYATQVERNKKLKKQVKKLKAENTSLKDENRELRDRVQKLELIVEELQSMIFKNRGRRKMISNHERKRLLARKTVTKPHTKERFLVRMK